MVRLNVACTCGGWPRRRVQVWNVRNVGSTSALLVGTRHGSKAWSKDMVTYLEKYGIKSCEHFTSKGREQAKMAQLRRGAVSTWNRLFGRPLRCFAPSTNEKDSHLRHALRKWRSKLVGVANLEGEISKNNFGQRYSEDYERYKKCCSP